MVFRLRRLRQWRHRRAAACDLARAHRQRQAALLRRNASFGRVIDPQYVAMMNQMMEETLLTGTAHKAELPGWQAAGKTGTSQEWRDAWFVGYTSYLVAGVWLGNDDGTPTKKVSGGNLPVEIWSRFMRAAHEGVPVAGLPSGRGATPRRRAPTLRCCRRSISPAPGADAPAGRPRRRRFAAGRRVANSRAAAGARPRPPRPRRNSAPIPPASIPNPRPHASGRRSASCSGRCDGNEVLGPGNRRPAQAIRASGLLADRVRQDQAVISTERLEIRPTRRRGSHDPGQYRAPEVDRSRFPGQLALTNSGGPQSNFQW